MRGRIFTIILFLSLPQQALADDKAQPAQADAPKAPAAVPEKKPDQVDISDLDEDYWRPNKDELEVVQNRRFEKAGRFELGVNYGIYQGQDYVNSRSYGVTGTYNITNRWFVEASYLNITNTENDFLKSVQNQYGFTPAYNTQKNQESVQIAWVPIYAKFSLLGQEISHFEMYIAPGVGLTDTTADHFTEILSIGQKFYITEHWILTVEWKISRFTDQVNTPQGATSTANGGPGYVNQTDTTNNILFGLGFMF